MHQTPVNDSHSFSVEEMNTIIDRTYNTRGVRHSYKEDPISIEPNQNMYRRNKIEKDK